MRIPAGLALVVIASLPADPATAKDKDKLVVTPGAKDGDVEVLDCAPKGRALFLAAKDVPEGKKPGLLVTLHGHGGKPDGYVFRDFAARRHWAVVAVSGRTPQPGADFTWDATEDPAYIAGVAKWVVQNRGIDPSQVVLFGHSMGGSMSLRTYAFDPATFAGIVTCAAPEVPDKRHETTRVCVFLGADDPNFSMAKPVQNQMKKDAGRLALGVVEGAGHNETPAATYLDLACDWLLSKGAIGREFRVPKAPPDEPAAGFRHVLLRYKGAADAKDVKRSKESAKKEADDLVKRVKAGKALLSAEAQALSDDEASAPLGGAIDVERLAGFGGALASVRDAAVGVAGPFESPAGWHVVERR
jgi:predicted esterase